LTVPLKVGVKFLTDFLFCDFREFPPDSPHEKWTTQDLQNGKHNNRETYMV